MHGDDVMTVIREALLEMQVAEKRQQDKDRIAFTVVVGAGVAAGKPEFPMAETGGRERASTGLLDFHDVTCLIVPQQRPCLGMPYFFSGISRFSSQREQIHFQSFKDWFSPRLDTVK